MIGCPHCEANQKAWKETKKMAKKGGIKTKEIESQDPQCDESSFPVIVLVVDGEKTKRVEGTRQSGDKVMKELDLQLGGRRRRSTKRNRSIRGKRFLNRTLRNNIAFR